MGHTKLSDVLRVVATELHDWSRNILGDLEKRIKRAKKELEECCQSAITRNKVAREQILRYKLGRLEDNLIYLGGSVHMLIG